MIIVRSPLRITLGGGGTDMPQYYESVDHGGLVVSAAINKYVYVTITKPFTNGIYLKYSELERVDKVDDVRHNIIRACLQMMCPDIKCIEITTLADVPAGTGLGSSSSFTCAMIYALNRFLHDRETPKDILADMACNVEIDILKEPIGKQDQYISAFGGIKKMTFLENDVLVDDVKMDSYMRKRLEKNTRLFFTGFTRNSSGVLKDQKEKMETHNEDMINNLNATWENGCHVVSALEENNPDWFAYLMRKHWNTKRQRSNGITSNNLDRIITTGIENGAGAGKIVGAGGGGFAMFYTLQREEWLAKAMTKIGCEEMEFAFDYMGTADV